MPTVPVVRANLRAEMVEAYDSAENVDAAIVAAIPRWYGVALADVRHGRERCDAGASEHRCGLDSPEMLLELKASLHDDPESWS